MRRTECGIFSMKMKMKARERASVDGTAADPRSCVIIELIINRGLS
jgi:hypothetical protein